jgi:hypothetical protein
MLKVKTVDEMSFSTGVNKRFKNSGAKFTTVSTASVT